MELYSPAQLKKYSSQCRQELNEECGVCCVSFIANQTKKTTYEIMKEIGTETPLSYMEMMKLICKCDFLPFINTINCFGLHYGGLYIVSIPSETKLGRMHWIVVDTRGSLFVFDPLKEVKEPGLYSSYGFVIEILPI